MAEHTHGVTAGELPDAIRVPLDELEADARYLAARLANGTMAPSVGAEAIQKRTRAIREALLALGVKGPEHAQRDCPNCEGTGIGLNPATLGTCPACHPAGVTETGHQTFPHNTPMGESNT